MLIDFKVDKDEYGYFVLAYRLTGGVEIQFNTNNTLAMTLNLLPNEFAEFLTVKFKSEEKPKNNRMHFSDYDDAVACMEGLRALLPKAIETNNLFLAE
jgi:hypothetical protein